MKQLGKFAGAVAVAMALAACLGEEARFPEEAVASINDVPGLAISDERGLGEGPLDYEPGELTGFSARLSADDAAKHGLPRVLEFVGRDPGVTSTAWADMTAYGGDNLPVPDVFECFGPIEILNQQQETILVIDNFCPSDTDPHLRIIGDMSAGTPLAWIFESPDGTSRNNLDAGGSIGAGG